MYPNFIQHIKRYISLSEDEEQILLKYIKPLTLKKKAYLLQEGEICKANYFVESGCLRMFFINEKGTEQIVQFALENWWLADYMSLTMQTKSPFYIQTIEPAEIIAIDFKKQDELFDELPQMERYFRIMMQRAYAATQRRFKFFHDYTKEENYRFFVSLFPEFVQRIPQYMLASYLGLTPEYLSELRKKHG
ncbi:Crp/Fnr family transcriptional regulator [Pedobacter sp. Hv1]|uniref:Crp/Fnr family transcriptional regulator n=1 Tax=Pedobacter sp. Hv1 TaxID=1740090 RepID=UPI0006D8B9D9|nr:Crp/Fnr family transcriptional regulator [Pedobacter sp. Hv1]KQB99341.1 cyclic nucleotide-binding protein [Pedobacter sp. Hv1]